MGTTITTSGSAAAGGSRRVAYDSSGNIWVMVWDDTANAWEFWYSTDDGANWTENTSLAITPTDSTPESGAFTINRNGDIAVCYVDDSIGGTGNAYWINGLTTSSSAWTEVSTSAQSGQANDVCVFQKPGSSNWFIALLTDTEIMVTEVTSAGVRVATRFDGFTTGNSGLRGNIDFNHTGDGCTVASSTPHLYAAFGSTSTVKFLKWTFSGTSTWTAASSRQIDIIASRDVSGAFDGTRFVFAYAGDTDGTVHVYQRDAADTTTTFIGTTADLGGAVASPVVSINPVNQDVYIVGSDATNNDVDYIRWTRATDTWDGSWTAIVDAITLEGTDCLTATKSQPGSDIAVVWDQTTTTTVFDAVNYNTGPTGPTWVTPVDGSAYDETATLAASWTFNDPNVGDTQSAYSLKRTISGTTTYYQASDNSWQVGEIKNASTTNGVTLPATWGADGESVTLAVKTWDQSDAEGVYGTSITVIGSTAVTPTLDAPATSATLATPTAACSWTVAEQSAYQIRILTSADVLLYTTGKITGSDASATLSGYNLANGLTGIKFELTTWNTEGLPATDTNTGIDVTYTAPLTPTLAVTTGTGYISVAITDPTPSGTPTVSYHDVWVRVAAGGRADIDRTVAGDGIRISTGTVATNGTYLDYAAASGVDYEYRTLAVGTTGATAWSAWT